MSLYYAYGESVVVLAYLDGLARHRVDGTRCAHLELVEDHVSQALVVDDADVDVRRELLAGDPRVHRLVAVVVVAGGEELLAKIVDSRVFFREPVCEEGSSGATGPS